MQKSNPLKKQTMLRHNLPALLIFLWLPIYGFAVVCRFKLSVVENITYLFHCVDFSMGFCNKFLPGTIYNLFVSKPSQITATIYEYILLFVFYFVLAFVLQKWFYKLQYNECEVKVQLLFLYLAGPCTFSLFIYELGMLDVSWVYLSVLFILCMQNRYCRFILPLFAIPAVMVHYGAMLCYIPFWALLLLYEAISADKKREKKIWYILLIFTCIFSVLTFFYFIVFDKKNVTYDIYTFNEIIKERGSTMLSYFDYALYCTEEQLDSFVDASGYEFSNTDPGFFKLTGIGIFDFIITVLNQVIAHSSVYSDKNTLKRVLIQPVIIIFILLPVLGMFFGFIKNRLKDKKGNKLEAFFCLCLMALIPFSLFGSVFISTDSNRWLSHGYLCLFTIILYIIYKEGQLEYIKRYIAKFPPAAVAAWSLIYMFTIFDPYV